MKKTILLLCLLTSATAFAQFSGKGTGDSWSPYEVTTAAQLDELRNCLKEETYVKLMNDIDLTDYISKKYPNGGWEPINCSDKEDSWDSDYDYFYYVYFDGNNKTISGLSIKSGSDFGYEGGSDGYGGLFGFFSGEMKNLSLKCNINGQKYDYVGGLCGYSDSGDFYNCQVEGSVSSYQPTGGLCGYNDNGRFESCTLAENSSVSGDMECGGICGYTIGGEFNKCYNKGTVYGSDGVGGIVGVGDTWIRNCRSIGKVTASLGNAGGIMGISNSSWISNCGSSGIISAHYGQAGGIVGSDSWGFFPPDDEMYQKRKRNSVGAVSSKYAGIGGKVRSVIGMAQVDDEDDPIDNWNSIMNCSSSATVSAYGKVGGIIGECWKADFKVDKCRFFGIVKMSELDEYDEWDDDIREAFGGIAGKMNGTISNCMTEQYGSESVSGLSKVGGIVGYLKGTLVNSYAHGYVTGDKYVGGLCGYVEGSSSHRASILSACNYNWLVEVNTKDGEIGRVVGHIGNYCDIPSISAAKSNRSDMYYPVKRKGAQLTPITENLQNGRNVARSLESEEFFYESMGWDMERTWYFEQWYGDDMPSRFMFPLPLLDSPGSGFAAGYHLRTDNCVINKSTGGRVKMVMSHSSSVHSMLGVQFDLVLPKGVTIKKKSNGKFDIQKMGVLAKHEISCLQQADGSYRFMVYSLDMSRFDYEADYLMSIALEVADDVKCDYYDIIVKNVTYSQLWGDDATEVTSYNDFDTYNLLEIANGKLGDVNGDGTVTVADAMAIVDHVLGAPVPVFNEGNADVNGDGSIDITDVMTVVQWIVSGNKTYNLPQNSMEEMTVSREEGGYLLQLGNMADYTALQMNVRLPEGCKLQGVELSDARSNGHQVVKHQLDDGSWNIVVWGVDGNELRSTSTDLLRLQTTGHGAGDVVVSDIILTNHDHENISIQTVAGGATGIAEVEAGEPEGVIYDLNGVRVEHPTKGVYVRNGKKFVVK